MARLMMTMQVVSSKGCRIVCGSVGLKPRENWNKERVGYFSQQKGLGIEPFLHCRYICDLTLRWVQSETRSLLFVPPV